MGFTHIYLHSISLSTPDEAESIKTAILLPIGSEKVFLFERPIFQVASPVAWLFAGIKPENMTVSVPKNSLMLIRDWY